MKKSSSKLCVMVFSACLVLFSVNLYAEQEGISTEQSKQQPSKNEKPDQVDEDNELQEIIKRQTDAIKSNPKNATAYYNRGFAYHSLKEYDKAIQDYTRAIELDPRDMRAYNNRGIVYDRQKQYGKSIVDFTQAILLYPRGAGFYMNRGAARFNLQQYEKSIDDYTQVVDLQPNHAAAYSHRGRCYMLLENYRQACADAHKACEFENCKLLEHLLESEHADGCE